LQVAGEKISDFFAATVLDAAHQEVFPAAV